MAFKKGTKGQIRRLFRDPSGQIVVLGSGFRVHSSEFMVLGSGFEKTGKQL